MIVLGVDGSLASRAIGAGVPNRRAIFVERPKGTIVVEPSVGLCISFEAPGRPAKPR